MKPLWRSWPSVRRRILSSEQLFLFLDYDGTLVPIAERPSQARLPAETRRLLGELAGQRRVRVALVSGRNLRDLKQMVDLPGLLYVGNHGLELEGPRLRYTNPAAQASRPVLQEIARRLETAMKPIAGGWVEDKGFTLSVHYRSVAKKDLLLVKNGFYEAVGPYLRKKQIKATTGKRVFEVRPAVHWTKGTVIDWLLARRLATTDGARVLPVYVGDDQTDEDAFNVLKKRGVTIAVSPASRLCQAQYRIRSPRDVRRFLRELSLSWKNKGNG